MDEKRLTKEIAEQFLADKDFVDLEEFTDLDDDAAESLSKAKYDLYLNGLTGLSDAAAECLGKHSHWLHLNGLASLSDASAESLSKHEEWLSLNGLTELSDAAADSFSRHAGWVLSLGGLTSLSDAAAESLSRHESDRIDHVNLSCLTSLLDEAAESLSRHEDGLSLDGVTAWSDGPGHFRLRRKMGKEFDELDDDELDDVAAEGLSKHEGNLNLNGLASLSDASAESLSKHEGRLYLNSLTSLSDTAAESLSKHKGLLSLNGLTSLSDAAAECLSKHADELDFNGATSLPGIAAESLQTQNNVLHEDKERCDLHSDKQRSEFLLHKRLWHFTDPSNIPSIREFGLLSWARLVKEDISHIPGSDESSRQLDRRKEHQDYVRICHKHHPMAFFAKMNGRISQAHWLEIDSSILSHAVVKYSDKNANSTNAVIDDNPDTFFKSSDRQAEILIKGHIPAELILNLPPKTGSV